MSWSLFAERYTEAFNRPPMDLPNEMRLHRSAQLLRSTNLFVQIIALAVGYASRSYFFRAFKTACVTDPKAFREKARGHLEASRHDLGRQGRRERRWCSPLMTGFRLACQRS